MTAHRTARAAVMVAPRSELQLREYPMPTAPPGGALVRVSCCTICRSDLHTWTGRRPGPTPVILGHEIVGTVSELGEGLAHDVRGQQLTVGDRVTWTLLSSCGKCRYCAELHLPMKCCDLRKYGHESCAEPPHLRGGFAEYCLIDAGTGVLKLPADLPDMLAAPVNCAAATVAAGCDAAELKPGETVLIQGAGALGCYAAAFAAYAGCHRVIVTDIDAGRLEFIRQFGATNCIDVSHREPLAHLTVVRDLTGGFGVDCVLEVAGAPSAVATGLQYLRKGGRYIELGCSFPNADATIDMSYVLWNLLTIRGVHNYDVRHLCQAVDMLTATRDRFPYAHIVGATYPLDRVNEALAAAESGGAMRIAITC